MRFLPFARTRGLIVAHASRPFAHLVWAAWLVVTSVACQQPATEPPAGAVVDAKGVDAEFGVETFALSAPSLVIQKPIENAQIAIEMSLAAPIPINVCLYPTNVNIGTAAGNAQIACRLDGGELKTTAALVGVGDKSGCSFYKIPYTLPPTKGMHHIQCYLVDQSGAQYPDATAHAVRHIYVTGDPLSSDPANSCDGQGKGNTADCDDGNACSEQLCVGTDSGNVGNASYCIYSYVNIAGGCCTSGWDCKPGETCLGAAPGVAGKCTACLTDLDCDDKHPCTVDSCDLSGLKGVCKHTPTPDCCEDAVADVAPGGLCDDGKVCTTPTCGNIDPTTGKGTCTYQKVSELCCDEKSDCPEQDKCSMPSCVDNECRYGIDPSKPDCCSDKTNVSCNDKNPCTDDKCDPSKVMPGGWVQCTHTTIDLGPGKVCCNPLGGGNECDDGNGCTQDVCNNGLCEWKPLGICCSTDLDCDDGSICTADKCNINLGQTSGTCSNTAVQGCCESDADCDDNLKCTTGVCNVAQNLCIQTKADPTCCDTSLECDDGNYCTGDACVNNICLHGPDATKPGCCVDNSWCNDNSPCTVDTCDVSKNLCQYTSNGDPTCCAAQADCDDKDCTTLDFCDATNKCQHKAQPDQCKVNVDCDDDNACTIDQCDTSSGCGVCKHSTDPKCCSQDFQCDDSKPLNGQPANPNAKCTLDKCVAGYCQNTAIAQCCIDDKDAITACDDKNGCTIDYCSNNTCKHTKPKNGCCVTAADCNDGDKCTTDACPIKPGESTTTCTNTLQQGCLCSQAEVLLGVACNDNNDCTLDACTGGLCTHKPIEGCCLDKFDCDDGNACTVDHCIAQTCLHYATVDGNSLCCDPATEDVDCAYLNSECAKGVCAKQTDGTLKCEAQKLPVCTVNIGYCQDFASSTDLATMGWNPGDVKGTAAKNWGVAKTGKLGPDQYANFSWTPTTINYETCLQSPIIQAAGAQTITAQFDRQFEWNQGQTNVTVYASLDGANADWTNATAVHVDTLSGNVAAETVDFMLPQELSNSNGLRLAFCLSGASTYNLTNFSLDNVCVVKGGKPVFAKCPVNQIAVFGQSKSLPLKAYDPDGDAILSFSLVNAPSFINVSSAVYYWLDNSWNATMYIQPSKVEHIGTWPVTMKVSDGQLYSTCSFNVTVTYKGGYLVWRPAEVPVAAGDVIHGALKNAGKISQQIQDLSLYPNLSDKDGKFDGVFVALGVYPNNHVMSDGEGAMLQQYLALGGRVYMEGGDTWVFDPQTKVHDMFKVLGVSDDASAGITGPLNGLASPYVDKTQSPAKTYDWNYNQDFDFNNLNDIIAGKVNVTITKNILNNNQNTAENVQVAHDDPAGGYRTVASSVLISGVQPGAAGYTADDMVKRVLYFFDNGFKDCVTGNDCDDKNSCTVDSCSAGVCSYKNNCSCSPVESVSCGAAYTIVSNGSGSTNAIAGYSCDAAGTQFTGKEQAILFSSQASQPVTLTVSNLNNPKARVFVLKSTEAGCDPASCIAIGDASKPISFASAAGGKYFILIDAPDGGTAQADLKFACGTGEDCGNGKDDNGNGLVDCADLGSCCGDPACGEVCDGVDNDCDGAVDDGCNGDGDTFCNKDMTTVGTPPICPAGGGDCNDVDGAVNPGATEICANGKDDNCNGKQDEAGAVGCTNYWVDQDGDGFGGGTPQCLCAPNTTFKATKGGDCNDANAKVNPAQTEICGNNLDDDCSGTQNDLNAIGCSDFYTDTDGDGWGTIPKKCMCFGAGLTTATKPGDCLDTEKTVNPDALESCNNIDDDCDSTIDEGCDDDQDGYCDIDLGYVTIGSNTSKCGSGNDGQTVTLACDQGSTITDIVFASYGTPTGSCGQYAQSACHSATSVAAVKNLCLGKQSCAIAANTLTFGDPCSGTAKSLAVQYVCTSPNGVAPDSCPKGPGDTDDVDPKINPAGKEICDDKDNNSDGKIDEGCDDDKDGFCDASMVVIGVPKICPKTNASNGFGDDCVDDAANVKSPSVTSADKINPGLTENCATLDDDNCNGTNNELDAANCTVFFYDNDGDNYGTKAFKCMCAPVDLYKAKKTADCNDNDKTINPGAAEICDNVDQNCDTVVDEGCDDDGDLYCDAGLKLAAGVVKVCPNGGNDCVDSNPDINPSQQEICGNGVDDNCDGSQNDPNSKGCTVFYSDVDKDTFGSTAGQCLCVSVGTFTAANNADCADNDANISPNGVEVCNDKDDNCDGTTDEGCDDDQDGFCDGNMKLPGAAAVCPNSVAKNGMGDDCDDTDAASYPKAVEVCDDIDQDCDGTVDNGCDDDQDGYCDGGMTVANPPPAVCQKGAGDCDDLNSDQNPGAQEICGNGIDDNCSNGENDLNAGNCDKYYFDADKDGYGLNVSLCLCKAAGNFTAPQGNDCDDGKATVNPGAQEVCGDGVDNNCNVDQNDPNALGCKTFYFDSDKDQYGLSAVTACLCEGANTYTATQGGDCNDTASQVNPGKTEVCNNVDDNCAAGVDEGCDKDGDKYCNAAMTTVGAPNICPLGGGDCNDQNATSNPGFPEQCDDVDNNCNGNTDENCNVDGDAYCTTEMKVIGTPNSCPAGAGDCNDADKLVNPAAKENCATTYDDNCNGDTNDLDALGCTSFGVDADADTYSDSSKPTQCLCKATGTLTGTKNGDCNDKNNLVNPGTPELCDGVDNNCNGAIDEGCDGDKDGYCASTMITIGKPAICPKGGGDCNDANAQINPGQTEDCSTAADDNCNGLTNEQNALGCTAYYLDNDSDGWAVNYAQCLCAPQGGYNLPATKVGDCDDTSVAVNPAMPEVCGDGFDNNCNGTQNDVNAQGCSNFYVDGDTDGYGVGAGQCQCFAQGAYITNLAGDCDDADKQRNPGLTELCDDKDNDCNTAVDNGCDDDADAYCDAGLLVVGKPTVCTKTVAKNGYGDDCNDTKNQINPGVAEQCDDVDQNCDGATDNGCDDDKDGFCDGKMVTLGTPQICTKGGNDCDDGNLQVNPGKTELCDDLDNNCVGGVDEACDQDNDKYCDAGKTTVGQPAKCTLGGGDCNDVNAAVNPGAAEICDGVDNNCAAGTDEVCNDDDKDGYCTGSVGVSPACPKGGNDCDDTKAAVNPGASETCATPYDDNCNGKWNEVGVAACTNFYTDADADTFGIGTATCQCAQAGTLSATKPGDCNDTNADINPAALEVCNDKDDDCVGGVDNGCDDDKDSYCNSGKLVTPQATCTLTKLPASGTKPGDDCNDNDKAANPGASELCDNKDNNCNTLVDEGCDADNDKYCAANMTVVGAPAVCPAGGGDCNDQNATINPAAQENCTTAADDNCNGQTNELNGLGCNTYFTDADKDGYGVQPQACYCTVNGNFAATKPGDCNDADAAIYPNPAAEACDGKDNNCNGLVDEGCDQDGDGYCTALMVVTSNAGCPKTTITNGKGDDCNDLDKSVNPGGTELCDDVDNNCNGVLDDKCDQDGDQYCDINRQVVGTPKSCPKGGGDCADTEPAANPGSTEVCDGKDNNCNKLVDEANAQGCSTWYYDGDQDGVGVNSAQCLCGPDGLYNSKSNNDCNDTCPTCFPASGAKPAAAENCDGFDNDCNGLVDEGCNSDGDGYCTNAKVTIGTPPVCPKGGGDCNDSLGTINPGAVELCNNTDDNCNGSIDEGAGSACSGPNANMICNAGQCAIGSCHQGFFNLNTSITDGCECNGTDVYEPNDTCNAAYLLNANLSDAGVGQKELISGRLVDASDEDWFSFYGGDSPDSGVSVCDKYNVRAVFLANPGNLAFDISRGSCPNGINNTVCCGQTDFNWFTNFKGTSNGALSKTLSEFGECPCTTTGENNGGPYFDKWTFGWNVRPGSPGGNGPYCMNYDSGYVCLPAGYYFTQCQDNSAWYYMRVYKTGGAPVCANYKIEVSNGIYGSPGHVGYVPK